MDPETKDKLFLLSAEEVKRYFGVRDYYLANQHTYQLNSLSLASLKSTVSQSRRCPLDHFTMTHNWVTRTRSTNYKCAIVSSEELHDNTVLNATGFGIRPAMWVKMR